MKVVIPDDWNGAFAAAAEVEELRRRADVIVLGHRSGSLAPTLRDAEIVVGIRERTKFDARQLADMPRLKLIAQIGGQETPHIDVAAATRQGVLVCYSGMTPGPGGTASMTEVTIGMMIAALRQFTEQDRIMHAGGWPGPTGKQLRGKTLGVVGLGRLGTEVAKAAQFFGMNVIAAGRTLTPERAAAAGVEYRSLESLFAEADVISVHVKLNDTTRGMIDASLLGRMKPDALFINTSRGPLVVESALVEALREHRIGGAALDVYDEEPLPADNPLRGCENALLLGHCGYPTDAFYEGFIPRTLAVVNAFLDGAPINVINPEALTKATSA